MKVLTMRRTALLCAGLGAVGAISAVAFTGTSALYTSGATQQTNSITSGTITLGVDNTASKALDFGGTTGQPALMPGDYKQGHYVLDYTGSDAAFVGLDISVTSTAANSPEHCVADGTYAGYNSKPSTLPNITGTLDALAQACGGSTAVGTLPLFDGIWNQGSGAQPQNSPLGIMVSDYNGSSGFVFYSAIAPFTQCTVAGAAPIKCTATLSDALVRSSMDNTKTATDYEQWQPGDTVNLRLDVQMYATTPNAFQGSGVEIDLTGHAVQAKNNLATKGGTPDCDAATFAASVVADASNNTSCPASWS